MRPPMVRVRNKAREHTRGIMESPENLDNPALGHGFLSFKAGLWDREFSLSKSVPTFVPIILSPEDKKSLDEEKPIKRIVIDCLAGEAHFEF
ncbi:MAG: hypothetical protein ACYDBP_11610 [Leptospirales bacterium]